VVINLNQQVPSTPPNFHFPPFFISFDLLTHDQTDSSDLLGNWKPVDARVLIRPAVAEFEALFETTLSSRANAELLTQLRLRLDKGKFNECIKILSKGAVLKIVL
jgi:midasin (ATPase involved in ribosome maturation)